MTTESTTANAGDERDNICNICDDHKPCSCEETPSRPLTPSEQLPPGHWEYRLTIFNTAGDIEQQYNFHACERDCIMVAYGTLFNNDWTKSDLAIELHRIDWNAPTATGYEYHTTLVLRESY